MGDLQRCQRPRTANCREKSGCSRGAQGDEQQDRVLGQAMGSRETLSTADVIIRVVEQAYLKSKEDRTMSVPTEKKLLQRIKAGKEDQAFSPSRRMRASGWATS